MYEKQFLPVNFKGCFLTVMGVVHITFTANYEMEIIFECDILLTFRKQVFC